MTRPTPEMPLCRCECGCDYALTTLPAWQTGQCDFCTADHHHTKGPTK